MRISEEIVAAGKYANKRLDSMIIIESSVQRIEEKAFEGCDMYTILIEEGDTPIKIALNAFNKCKNLLEISSKRETVFYNKINYRRKYS